jgi:plastocyanin
MPGSLAKGLAALSGFWLVSGSVADGARSTVRGATVEGEVRIVTKSTRRLASAGAYPGRTIAAPVAHESSELANVVVFIEAGPITPLAQTPAIIRQVDETFVPHLVAITTGSTVEFPNDDLIFHNVFSLSGAATFDLGRYPRGKAKTRVFEKPGIVKVFCHLHTHMNAIVRVFDHPFFTIPDALGRFQIPDLPAGRHAIVAWHERAGEVSRTLKVDDGQTASISFTLPIAAER